jgi:bifunctional non-homologous end joining protein LigD
VSEDRLGPYRDKRSFEVTPEPEGSPGPEPGGSAPRFVVQEHAARALHYDFRIEADGALLSWAVPKGPSYDPKVKRLAVHVEDHPLDYRSFEGRIPDAQYGAGTVIVWDEGTYRPLTDGPVVDAVAAGHVSVWLEGTKLRGGWSLTRTGRRGDKEQWLLVKRADDTADAGRDITSEAPASVATGRTLEDLASADGDPAPEVAGDEAAFVAPMLASVGTAGDPARLRESAEWVYERKLDGLRCIGVVRAGEASLWSRNRLSFDRRFSAVVAALRDLPVDDIVLDGEIVAFDGERTSFSGLQRGGGDSRLAYVAFDLLHLLGRDLTHLPLSARRDLLARVLADPPAPIAVAEGLTGGEEELLERACADGWEGLIAKRLDRPYQSGRSRDWVKLVCTAGQELVVVGWTDPKRSRTGFGALLLAYHDADGRLRYAGKVGTGFNEQLLREVRTRLDDLATDTSPLDERVPDRAVHWVRPELVADIAFKEWTADGRLRHPSFQRLRVDKAASEVVREH